MEYDAIIIGAGVAGLFSALQLSLRGKKVLLLERQSSPGGYATSFRRKGFTFESSLHCVDGLGKGETIREFLEECGIAKELEFIELADFARIIYPEHDFVADGNFERYKDFLKKSFPREGQALERLFHTYDVFYKQFDSFTNSQASSFLKLFLSPLIYPGMIKMSFLTVEQLIGRCIKDQKLKGILCDNWRFLALPPSRLSALYFLTVFRGYYCESTAYIKGGYGMLFEAVARKIRASGSEVKFNTTVTRIVTDGTRRVRAVIAEGGERYSGKVIISNANAIDTLCTLLDDDEIKTSYRAKLSSLEKSLSIFQVYLGLKVPAKTLGMDHCIFFLNTTYDHEDNFGYGVTGDFDRCTLGLVDHSQLDPALVPQGKGSLLIMAYSPYAQWEGLQGEAYKDKKAEVTQRLIRRVEKSLPGLTGAIEVTEAATPLTMQRYSLSPEGAAYGFAQTVPQAAMNRLSQETCVKNLLLAGAWTFPGGGVHGCFFSGMQAAELALKSLGG